MTTKLLVQVHKQDQDALAERHNGTDGRQPRRKWCAEALKAELTEGEYDAACKVRRKCHILWAGRKPGVIPIGFSFKRDPVTGMLVSSTEAGQRKLAAAMEHLEGAKQAVRLRSDAAKAPLCVEWVAMGCTLHEVAEALGNWRSRGPDRPQELDFRPTKPFVRLVLLHLSAYYDDCADRLSSAA